MACLTDKVIVAAMELAVEADCLGEDRCERTEYVAENLRDRFPDLGHLTIQVVAAEIVGSRDRGLW